MAENPDILDVEEVAARLADLGLPTETIQNMTASQKTEAVLTYHRPNQTPAEKELAEDFRRLQQLAVREAFKILAFGPTEQKLAVIRASLSAATKSAGVEPGGGHDELKLSFETLMQEMRAVPEVPAPTPSTPALTFEESDAKAQAATPSTNDQNKVLRDPQVRP